MHKVLIVDDEKDFVNGMAITFKREGYQVFLAHDGDTALRIAQQENPHLILLDVMLPGMSGLEVCQALRRKEVDTRIVLLSAKGDEIDRVVGLEVGADDYLAKPFSTRELMALIRARLRYRVPVGCEYIAKYQFGDIEVDFERHITTRRKSPIKLTPRELEVLRFLIQRRGSIVTRDRILDKLWGQDRYTTARTVDNHILRLRRKLEKDPTNPQYILSIYGGGYKFVG